MESAQHNLPAILVRQSQFAGIATQAVFLPVVTVIASPPRSVTPPVATSASTADTPMMRGLVVPPVFWKRDASLARVPSLAALTLGCGLSPGHTSRLFVAQFGLTPHEYREQRRINAARRLLRGSSAPVKEIAFDLGFKQSTHFSAWFRERTGAFPRAFRDAEVKPSQAM